MARPSLSHSQSVYQVYMLASFTFLGVTVATAPSCSPEVGWVPAVQQHTLYLSDSTKATDVLTWKDARLACTKLNPRAELASCPRDIYDQTISCKIEPATPYWVGITAAYPSPSQIYWIDGSLETRSSQFSLGSNLSANINETCGHVNLTIHSIFHRPLDWTLSECSDRRPYICLLDKPLPSTFSSTSQQTPVSRISSPPAKTNNSLLASKSVQETMAKLQCPMTWTPLTCISTKASLAHANPNVLRSQSADIITLSSLITEDLLQSSSGATSETKLFEFFRTVDIMLQMAHVQNENKDTQMDFDSSNNTMRATLGVLFKTEEFIDTVLRSGALLSNISHKFARVDLQLVHTQLHNLPGLMLEIGNGFVFVENYTLLHSGSFNSSVGTGDNLTLTSAETSNNVTAIVAAILLDVPKTLVNSETEIENGLKINSPVLSLTCAVGTIKVNLQHTFSISVLGSVEAKADPMCGFQTRSETKEIWSAYGCEYINIIRTLKDAEPATMSQFRNGNVNSSGIMRHNNNSRSTNASRNNNTALVTCRCNHTTNFAVLMQVVDFQISRADRLALSVVTYIGCSASIISMVIAITVFCCLRSLNSERVCVHRNLCISMLAAQLTFISGINAVDEPTICASVALLLHYLVTASLVWMLVEGLHLYCQVVSVFGTWHARMKYYTAFGWGVPAVLVAVSAAVDWQGYGTKFSCWLSTERRTIWMFVGPVAAITLVNSVILVSVMKIAMAAASQDKRQRFAPVRAGAKACLFLCPLMGLTWLSGLAAVSRDLVVFQYIFASLNSLQGFFIFLFHCVLNTEVQQTLRRAKEKRSLQKIGLPRSSSTSQGQSSSADSRSPPTSARASPGLGPFFKRTTKVNPEVTLTTGPLPQ